MAAIVYENGTVSSDTSGSVWSSSHDFIVEAGQGTAYLIDSHGNEYKMNLDKKIYPFHVDDDTSIRVARGSVLFGQLATDASSPGGAETFNRVSQGESQVEAGNGAVKVTGTVSGEEIEPVYLKLNRLPFPFKSHSFITADSINFDVIGVESWVSHS